MYEFPCKEPVNAQIRVGGGTVEITAEQRGSATVEVQPADGSDQSREAADKTRVEFHDGRLTVEAPEGAGWLLRRSPRLRIRVRLPFDSSVQLKTASAESTAHGRYASFTINTASGDAYIEQVTGDVSANTASGDLRVTEVGGQLRVNTASGDLAVQVAGGPVTAKSASGDLEIEQAGGGVAVTTASGDVRVGTSRRGEIRINSASGDVRVGVVAGTGVWLDLSTLSGSTRSDLSVADGAASPAGGNPDLTVNVKTMSGDIEVRRVTAPATA